MRKDTHLHDLARQWIKEEITELPLVDEPNRLIDQGQNVRGHRGPAEAARKSEPGLRPTRNRPTRILNL